MASSSAQPIKGAYYPSWAQHFGLANIQTRYFTHIFYAFLNPKDGSFRFNIDNTQAHLLQTFTTTLHAKSPPVKALFAVGGGGNEPATSQLLARMASDHGSRAEFIRSSIDVARRFGFDGVDLDWEYPKNPREMENLADLLREWRQAVKKEAKNTGRPPLLLTAAVFCTATIDWPSNRAYPAAVMSKELDFINVMNYDYHGSWENATGAHAALYDPTGNLNTNSGIESWTRAGVPPSKLIMGLPLYGRTWRLMNPATSSGIGAPANGVVPDTDGAMIYAEVVKFNQANNARVVYDQATVSVYSVAGNNWISYDNPTSVRAKVQYARGRGLGGHFFWQVAGDYQWALSQTASASW